MKATITFYSKKVTDGNHLNEVSTFEHPFDKGTSFPDLAHALRMLHTQQCNNLYYSIHTNTE